MTLLSFFFFFKQKTAYEMRISDWSSDVCSSDLGQRRITACPCAPRQCQCARRRQSHANASETSGAQGYGDEGCPAAFRQGCDHWHEGLGVAPSEHAEVAGHKFPVFEQRNGAGVRRTIDDEYALSVHSPRAACSRRPDLQEFRYHRA